LFGGHVPWGRVVEATTADVGGVWLGDRTLLLRNYARRNYEQPARQVAALLQDEWRQGIRTERDKGSKDGRRRVGHENWKEREDMDEGNKGRMRR
jgi:hypothetical protein